MCADFCEVPSDVIIAREHFPKQEMEKTEKKNGREDRIVRSPGVNRIRNEMKSWKIRSEGWKELSPRGVSPPRLHSSELMSPKADDVETPQNRDWEIFQSMRRQNELLQDLMLVLTDIVSAMDRTNARLDKITLSDAEGKS